MRLSVISFTENGKQLSVKIWNMLKTESNIEIVLYSKCRACINAADAVKAPPGQYTGKETEEPTIKRPAAYAGKETEASAAQAFVLYTECTVKDWAKIQMQEKNAMLFIGACGIAVRAIAPFLTDKLHDVPVLVMDEKGNYIIPVLSGHMGGANDLAHLIAGKTGSVAVITTATDINGKFAIDVFAKKNALIITEKDGIAKVSAKALAGKEIVISIEPGHEADEEAQKGSTDATIGACLPEGVRLVPYPPAGPVDVVITSQGCVFDAALCLKPREYIIGIGCRRGKDVVEIEMFIAARLKELGICKAQIYALASISMKHAEPGLVEWCCRAGVPLLTYAAEELRAVEGNFSRSSFVEQQTGVDNVCERAAVKACGGGGILIAEKYADQGMTIAVAKRLWRVRFYDE